MKFKSQKKLDSHIQAAHERIPKFPCDTCGVLFVTRPVLRKHKWNVHERFVKYGCPTCDKHFFVAFQLVLYLLLSKITNFIQFCRANKCWRIIFGHIREKDPLNVIFAIGSLRRNHR